MCGVDRIRVLNRVPASLLITLLSNAQGRVPSEPRLPGHLSSCDPSFIAPTLS